MGERVDGGDSDPLGDALARGVTRTDVLARILRGDGTPGTISMSVAPIGGPGGPSGAVVTATDITARQELEELRDAFVGILSHELRTPITSIFGGVELLRRDALPDEVRRGVIDDLGVEADRLRRLVDDLLVVARLEKGVADIGRDPVLLQRLLASVARSEGRHWPRHRFELQVPPDLPPVRGEDGYIEQVVRNLLSNAAKYGSEDGLVEVHAEQIGDEVRVRVLDDGPGIPDWAVHDVFKLFYRVPGADQRASGSGIGLFMSRVIVESLEGRIWAAARPAGGTEVGFALPLMPIGDEE